MLMGCVGYVTVTVPDSCKKKQEELRRAWGMRRWVGGVRGGENDCGWSPVEA